MALRLNYKYYEIPQHTAEAIETYLFHGYEPGSFVRAVLCNDLMGAVTRCDHINSKLIVPISKFVMHTLPGSSWGSWEIMLKWIHDEDGIRSQYVEAFEKRLMWETLTTA